MGASIISTLAMTDGQMVALQFVGAIFLVIMTAVVMKLFERARRVRDKKELDAVQAAAESQAQKTIAQGEAEAKSLLISTRKEFDAETEKSRQQLRDEEKRLAKRGDSIDQKLETLSSKERMLDAEKKGLLERESGLVAKDRRLNDVIAQQKGQLMKVAQLSKDQARQMLLDKLSKDLEGESADLIKRKVDEANDTAEEKVREIIVTAIQRYASDHTSDTTVSTVTIPSDDIKGRVIGREGRNIRAFEKATGVDVIVDDTPGVVVVSAFDPVRREIAGLAMKKLIEDGRIHPTRIEEIVANTEKEIRKKIQERGKAAILETKIKAPHNKLVDLLGRLHFRTSYGQNVLKHSLEVGFLAKMMAEEIGLNGDLAMRCGLLHDIGKAADHEVQGGHPQIGADLCKRYNEREEVINAAAGHHGDVAPTSMFTPLVSAADAISASRPGARRESLDRYVKRLQKLEEIATAFEGIKQAYAVQAGREVRVMVDAENVDDRLSSKIARDIARRVEEEMEYPGEIKITLVREVRYEEYAR